MFPSKERHQVEKEERKQAAEQEYRAEVRAGLDRPTLTAVRKGARLLRIVLALVLAATILAVIVVNALMSNRSASQSQHRVSSSPDKSASSR